MGKKIAIIFGALVLVLMIFMLTSQPSAPIKDASRPEIKPQDFAPKQERNEELNLQDAEEIKKIKQLQLNFLVLLSLSCLWIDLNDGL